LSSQYETKTGLRKFPTLLYCLDCIVTDYKLWKNSFYRYSAVRVAAPIRTHKHVLVNHIFAKLLKIKKLKNSGTPCSFQTGIAFCFLASTIDVYVQFPWSGLPSRLCSCSALHLSNFDAICIWNILSASLEFLLSKLLISSQRISQLNLPCLFGSSVSWSEHQNEQLVCHKY